VATITRIPVMNAYVGTAKVRPDSRTPRRLAAASSVTSATAMATRCWLSDGNAEMMLSVPDATDTATVST
jgi:hypothetical protein